MSKQLQALDAQVSSFMAQRGLGYTAARGYEAHQVFCAARDAGVGYMTTVIARLRTDSGQDYFCYGFYNSDDAEAVAQKVKRVRKYWVMDVIIVEGARRV